MAPPTMAPVLLGLADMDGWEPVVAPVTFCEPLVGSVVGCFVLDDPVVEA